MGSGYMSVKPDSRMIWNSVLAVALMCPESSNSLRFPSCIINLHMCLCSFFWNYQKNESLALLELLQDCIIYLKKMHINTHPTWLTKLFNSYLLHGMFFHMVFIGRWNSKLIEAGLVGYMGLLYSMCTFGLKNELL